MNKELINYLDKTQKKGISKSQKAAVKKGRQKKGVKKAGPEIAAREPLPLTKEQATILKRELKNNPEQMVKWAKGAFDAKIELIDLVNYLIRQKYFLRIRRKALTC